MIDAMDRLAGAHELLDGALPDRSVLVGNLRDLRRVNRLAGGVDLSRRAIASLLAAGHGESGATGEGPAISLLDVGTGAADIPAALLGSSNRGIGRLEIVAVDSRPEVLEAALELDPGLATLPGLTLRVADGLRLPFEEGAFEIAHASLVLHHLEPAEAVAMLRELRRVARAGVVINDLARGRLPFVLAWLAIHGLTRNRFTRHDGPMSVRRAYTVAEATDLLTEAGLRVVRVHHGLLRHRWAIAAGPA
jgi:ubiquinone/menaquinone biosynthesis C-methylase UbiE